MEDSVSSPGSILRTFSDSALDFDLVDELLVGGCWLETTPGWPDLFMPSTSTPSNVFDSSLNGLSPDVDIKGLAPEAAADAIQNRKDRSVTLAVDNPIGSREIDPNTRKSADRMDKEGASTSADRMDKEGASTNECGEVIDSESKIRTGWWIEPQANAGPSSSSVKERLLLAVNYIKESAKDGNILVQIWVPTNRGGRNVLTTSDQPYWHDSRCQRLVNYRNVSTNFQFPAEEDSNEAVGLPGRVFKNQLPEWTPDVRLFSPDEYPRVLHAQFNGVQGSLALPVFEHGSRSCLGVVEVIMTSRKVNYRPELETICSALQAVNLRSSEVPNLSSIQAVSMKGIFAVFTFQEDRNTSHMVIPEIQDILKVVCEAHKLPLAQTWAPCIYQSSKGCRHSDENYKNCVSPVDAALYVTDPRMQGFYEACSEHHLLKGQGVVGKAFITNQPCFINDITTFRKSEYPLSHYAKLFGLQAAVAIRLKSLYKGVMDYVLELFLPVGCTDNDQQKLMMDSLSSMIQQACRTFRVVMDKEVEEVPHLHKDSILVSGKFSRKNSIGSGKSSRDVPSWISSYEQSQHKGKIATESVMLDFKNKESSAFRIMTQRDQSLDHTGSTKEKFSSRKFSFVPYGSPIGGKFTDRKRSKTEKNISLEVLQQYFAGSLKDAAKSIGVCPTTLKRICRQHGISRWPSRKIKKVGHSLQKIQLILDSVQGVEGGFQIPSIYDNFPNVFGSKAAPQELPGSTTSTGIQQQELPKLVNASVLQGTQKTDVLPVSHSPSSSCSHSSSSSLSCSSSSQQQLSSPLFAASPIEIMDGNESGSFKRAYSEAELNILIKEEIETPARSFSYKALDEEPCVHDIPLPLKTQKCSSRNEPPFRVKVAYGDDKVRFSLQPSWGFHDLKLEIGKRFDIADMSTLDLKYLDDDLEWVLLTCDADLDECKDVCRSFGSQAIKLKLHIKQLDGRNSFSQLGGFS